MPWSRCERPRFFKVSSGTEPCGQTCEASCLRCVSEVGLRQKLQRHRPGIPHPGSAAIFCSNSAKVERPEKKRRLKKRSPLLDAEPLPCKKNYKCSPVKKSLSNRVLTGLSYSSCALRGSVPHIRIMPSAREIRQEATEVDLPIGFGAKPRFRAASDTSSSLPVPEDRLRVILTAHGVVRRSRPDRNLYAIGHPG